MTAFYFASAVSFSSGLAAVSSILYLLKSGDHIVCGDDVYGGVNTLLNTLASRMGIEVTFVDATNVKNIEEAVKNNTRMLWMESPTNPTMKLCDIKATAKFAKSFSDVLLVVDNTFMSSYFQRPLALGANIVMYSATKYMNGHSDVIMGAAVTNDEDLNKQLLHIRKFVGTIPSPFDCFLVNRGLKTLHLRMKQHMQNSLAVARLLQAHKMVREVRHPGLESHPQHDLALEQCSGFTGVFSFYIKGGAKEAKTFATNLKLFSVAESLGGVESLVEIPAQMTHVLVSEEHRLKLGIDDSLIRLSIGVESTEDLLADVKQALDKVSALK